jgi:prephenate dehydratase
VGETCFVRGEVVLGIRHCLVAREGTSLDSVRRVLSHEQVRRCTIRALVGIAC